MNSLFTRKKKKSFVERMKHFDKTHKVPNWISAIIVIVAIIITIKIVLWMITK